MTTQPTTDIEYYYDLHPTKEDLMGDSITQFRLDNYLINVLQTNYADQNWLILSNVNLYHTDDPNEYPAAPDVAVWIGRAWTEPDEHRRSWRVGLPDQPPPTVVFEVASKKTWRKDLTEKPQQYAAMGIKEYYAYDPNKPRLWRRSSTRLRGWMLQNGAAVEMALDEQGRLWSDALQSWLVEDDLYLRLTDRDGGQRLTSRELAEATEIARRVEQRARERAEYRAQEAERVAYAEQQARADAEQRARAEREEIRARLIERGLNPDDFLR